MTNIYDKEFSKNFSIPSLANQYINLPTLLQALGNVKNKKILELGCGNGYFLRSLVDKGAVCTGIDLSEEQLEIAKQLDKSGKIKFVKGDATKDLEVELNSFDIALLIRVLLEFSKKDDCKNTIKHVYSSLKKNGKLVIVELHPLAPNIQKEIIETPQSYNYFSSGCEIKCISNRVDGTKEIYTDHHWTLQDLSERLYENKFLISKITEQRATDDVVSKFPKLKNWQNPMGIMIEAIKI